MSRKGTRPPKAAPRAPSWIHDRRDQEEWNGRFIEILRRDYPHLDPSISAILSDEGLSQTCGMKIRSYVDKDFTAFLYEQRKTRGRERVEQLKIAVAGLNAAVRLYEEQGNQALATYLSNLALEVSGMLERWRYAYATKRHGRDRAHLVLADGRTFLESKLGHSITYVTLANLVNAGYEADGNSEAEPVTEEQIRKNLVGFERNNPLFGRNKIAPHS